MIRQSAKAKAKGKQKWPVIIYNRGGNSALGRLDYVSVLRQLSPLAQQGFIVLASQYRGSVPQDQQTYGKDQFGGADVRDIHQLIELAKKLPAADANNIFLYGISRGGMMSYLAVRDMPQLKALIVEAGVAELESHLVHRPDMEKNVYSLYMPNYTTEKKQLLKARSVLDWLDKLPPQLPILLLHGDKDVRVEVAQSQNLAKALADKGHPHKLVVYPGADHDLNPNRAEADAETAAWLKQYL